MRLKSTRPRSTPPSLALGDLDGDGKPEALLQRTLLHLMAPTGNDDGEMGDGVQQLLQPAPAGGFVFGVPRAPSEYVRRNPLANASFEEDERLVVIDANGDGDMDVIALRSGGVRLFLSPAAAIRARALKCKFGGEFDTRPCWSCGAPPPAHQVSASANLSEGVVRCVPPPLDAFPSQPRVYGGRFRVELSFNDQQWTQRNHSFEYLPPWSPLSVYPTAGPSAGGTPYITTGASGGSALPMGQPAAWAPAI